MKSRPLMIFGYIGFLCETDKDTYRDILISNPTGSYDVGYYYFFKGRACPRILETGETIPDRTPGFLNIENTGTSASTAGTLRSEYPEDTAWICFPSNQNSRKGLPTLESVVLNTSDTISLTNGSNLYLVSGQLTANNKTFTGPYGIRVRNGDITLEVVSTGTVYALKVL